MAKGSYSKDGRSNKGEKTETSNRRQSRRSSGRGYPRNANKPNSADWYYTDTQYRDAVANLPINLTTGYPADIHALSGTRRDNWECIPGIMTIMLHEAVGPADTMVDPINQAAFKLWTYIRSTMSGATLVADAQDIMMYVMAVRSLYAWLSSLKKVYGLLTAFDVTNNYLPRYILEAEGWNYDDLLQHKPELEAFINVNIDKVNNFVLPNTMPIFNRTVFLSESVYMDATSFRSQIYDFVWDNHYMYKWNGGPNGSGSYLQEYWPNGRVNMNTYADIRLMTDSLINALFTNEDIGTISGYMLRAFGDNRIVLGKLDPSYKTPFVYSEEILTQIQNLRCYGRVLDATITQDPSIDNGTIKCSYVLADSSGQNGVFTNFAAACAGTSSYTWNTSLAAQIAYRLEGETLMTFHKDIVTADDWLTSTRLAESIVYDGNAGKFTLDVGSEYVVDVRVWAIFESNVGGIKTITLQPFAESGWFSVGFSSQFFVFLEDTNWGTAVNTVFSALEKFAFLRAFRFGPYWRPTGIISTNGTMSVQYPTLSGIDLDVNALVDYNNLKELHRCAILGEFNMIK